MLFYILQRNVILLVVLTNTILWNSLMKDGVRPSLSLLSKEEFSRFLLCRIRK